VIVAGGASALLAAFAGSASAAATINVDSAADGAGNAANCTDFVVGNCTLRDASLAAVDGDVITFDTAVSAITLTNGNVDLNAVTLTGNGSANLTITTTAVAGSYDVFYVSGTGDVVISGMSLTKNRINFQNDGNAKLDDVSVSGSRSAFGGALYAGNLGNLEIVNSNFDGNYASSNGGAVYAYNRGSVTISNSSFTDNEAGREGGALFTSTYVSGTISLTDSVFTGNYSGGSGGAAMFYSDETANLGIINSTFTGNAAGKWAGAFYIMEEVVDVTIFGSTMSGNYAVNGSGAAYIENSGDLTITNSTIADNISAGGSGGLYLNNSGNATITNTLISGNQALDGNGGGIANNAAGVLTINNSTLTGNSANNGGAILNDGLLVINQSTIAGNSASVSGGGVATTPGASPSLSGTIVSGNSSGVAGTADFGLYSEEPSDTGSFTATNSLIGEVDPRLTANGTNNIMSTNPMLGALADNGGPTKTMALLTGSPAINAGPNPVATFIGNEFDQRGAGYARVVGGVVDIGAFEVQPGPAPSPDTPVVPAFTG
jgi:predicted outer membrane repeat protein